MFWLFLPNILAFQVVGKCWEKTGEKKLEQDVPKELQKKGNVCEVNLCY